MFKRRRPDEAPETATAAGGANPLFEAPKPAIPTAAASAPASPMAAPATSPPARADGLGVPQSRPTPSPTKEAATMSRPPVPSAPTPGLSPQSSSLAPPPRPGALPMSSAAAAAAARPQTAERRTLVVGRGISVQGSVQDAERLVVEGTVEATNIRAQELSVAPGGVFRGEIEVEEAELAGTIDGTLVAHGTLVVRSSGKLLGAARCRRLQVEDGGQISGRIEMLTENTPHDVSRPSLELAKPTDRPAPVPPAPAEIAAG